MLGIASATWHAKAIAYLRGCGDTQSVVAAANHLRNADALQRLDGTGLHRHDLCPLALPALPIGVPSPRDHILRRDCHCVLSPEKYMLISLHGHRNGIAVRECAGAVLMTCSSYTQRDFTDTTSPRSTLPELPNGATSPGDHILSGVIATVCSALSDIPSSDTLFLQHWLR